MFDGENENVGINGKIHVSKVVHEKEEDVYWEDLFSGFSRLYAITFSSGMEFACKLINKFEYAEIIFGNQSVMSFSLQEIIAFQSVTNVKLGEAATKSQVNFAERIQGGTLHLWVAREQLSHEKIYLLESDDGRKRVIMGSANMSRIAFTGKQRENIVYTDSESMFDAYKERFEEMKENSVDSISKKVLAAAKDKVENGEIGAFPMEDTLKRGELVILDVRNEAAEEEIRFSVDVKQIADKLAPYVPSLSDKNGKIILGAEGIRKIKRVYKEAEEKKKEVVYEPYKLTLDMENRTAALNGKPLDLMPKKEEVKADVDLFLQYMDGFSSFSGDWVSTQRDYYSFANWYFCSIFIMRLRIAAITNEKTTLAYPAHACVCGKASAGKTTFLKALEKMTLGASPVLGGNSYTKTAIDKLRRTVQGPAIVVDDVSESGFRNNGENIIKNENFGVDENLESAACLCFSANTNIKAFAPEITKRMLVVYSDINMTNEEAYKNNGAVASLRSKMGTALYREYLYRMIPIVNDIITELKHGKAEDIPRDVLAESSYVLYKIFEEHTKRQLPNYITDDRNYEKYFGTEIVSRRAIKEIRLAWEANKKDFIIDKKRNRVTYNAKEVYVASKLGKSLPPDLNVETVSSYVSFSLKRSEKYFGKMFVGSGGFLFNFFNKKRRT